MTEQRNINGWHLLTLALAFVAGGALTMHLPGVQAKLNQFGSATDLQSVSLPESQQYSTPDAAAIEASVQPVAEIPVTEIAETTGVTLLTPGNIPLFLQNEIDDLRFEAERSREGIADLREQLAVLATADNRSSSADVPLPPDVFTQRPARGTLNRDALIQAGVTPDLVDSIQQRQDQQSLARLELFDRAAREGWSNSDRLTEEVEALEEANPSLREELGDRAYDDFLHNAGRANRVVVTAVITGSTADNSGVQVGDVIYSYASNRIFNRQELRAATQEGVRDEPIVLEVLRDQQPFTLDAIRGPLGISMSTTSVSP